MQAVCDSKYVIRDVFIGYPGSVHDARVFRNSSLCGTLQQKCGDHYILADSAYPCLRNLLTPYQDNGHLNDIEKNYNFTLSKCRIVIEHTFGILKQKFRQLYHLKLRNIDTICHFIRATCVLHNLSVSSNDIYLDEIDVENNEVQDDVPNAAGNQFRNYIAIVLFNQE